MIVEFKGEYQFLSNSYESPFETNNIIFLTVEHYYRAMKTSSYQDFLEIVNITDIEELKKQSELFEVRDGWNDVKVSIMEYALFKKFENYPLRGQLLDTNDLEIINSDDVDLFWGMNLETGDGENKLGKMLMILRGNIRKEEEYKAYVIDSGGVIKSQEYNHTS